jgi:hypothetical protein
MILEGKNPDDFNSDDDNEFEFVDTELLKEKETNPYILKMEDVLK